MYLIRQGCRHVTSKLSWDVLLETGNAIVLRPYISLRIVIEYEFHGKLLLNEIDPIVAETARTN